MISLVVPTRNRAYALEQVFESFYQQSDVNEIVIIDDAGTDNTPQVVDQFARRYKDSIRTVYLRNSERKGAAYSRMEGVKASSNEFILFCDDDQFLGPDYAHVCHRKIQEYNASIVSGRKLYRLPKEKVNDAILRFGNGLVNQRPFELLRFRVNIEAHLKEDLEIPFTHDAYLVRRSLLLYYGLDPFYSRGNGFREESDVQMRAFLDGHRILVTNDAHVVHFHLSEVRSGGQRVSRLRRYYWTVYYTHYFYKKYFVRARAKLGIPYSKSVAITLYALAEFYVFFIRPFFIAPRWLIQRWGR